MCPFLATYVYVFVLCVMNVVLYLVFPRPGRKGDSLCWLRLDGLAKSACVHIYIYIYMYMHTYTHDNNNSSNNDDINNINDY